jgi:hypothetical protein
MRSFNGLAVVFGLLLLAIAVSYRIFDRYSEGTQTAVQSVVGGVADVSGVTRLYLGLTGRDLATKRHQGLSDAQQRGMTTTGVLWILGMLLLLYFGVRSGLRAFRSRSSPGEKEEVRQDPKPKRKG